MQSLQQKWAIFLLALLLCAGPAAAERVKDLASFAGVRGNQLVGFGLIVGLDKTGDNSSSSRFTGQSLRSMLARQGVKLPPDVNLRSKNIASVMVHAELPPFAKPGQTIDVTVSSIGDAKSLRGGSLLMTPLKGADGQVYAMAQGNLLVSGLSESGQDGSRVTVNVPSAGRIPGGATVERTVPTPFAEGDYMVLNLHTPDFTTAKRVAEAIARVLGPDAAQAQDGVSVRVRSPHDPAQRVTFASLIENLDVAPADAPARIIINSRTGTVVINGTVRVKPAAVSHGNLVVSISERPQVSQPQPFSSTGETAVVPKSTVEITEENKRAFVFDPGTSLEEIVRAVNNVGAAPSDLVAILEALKTAGALTAELIVI